MAGTSAKAELDDIREQLIRIAETTSIELLSKLQAGSPRKTGNFLRGWRFSTSIDNKGSFHIFNDVSYGWILWRGRRKVNGRWYGSKQGWGLAGGQKVVDEVAEELQKRLDKLEPRNRRD